MCWVPCVIVPSESTRSNISRGIGHASGTCFYTVHCTLPDATTAKQWVHWLRTEHLDDVRRAGASIVRLDSEQLDYEVRYAFADREAYMRYAEHHAPALQAEGAEMLSAETRLVYRRSVGEAVG